MRLIVESPVNTIETNVHGTEMVLKLANKKRKKVLLASTSEVYGKANTVPFREDDDLVMGPTSKGRWSYACSKAIDEFLGLAYHKEKRLPVVVARLFNTVGPRQTGRYGMVIPNFVKQALLGHPLTVFGDGTQTRCFTYVTRRGRALVALAEEPRAVGEVFNIGNDREEITILELARRVALRTALEEPDRARALRPGLRGGLRGHAPPRARPHQDPRAHRLRAAGPPRRDPRPRDRLLHLRRDPAVKPAEYRRMFEAEERQWWYAGQRAIATALLEPALGGRRRRARRLLDAGCGTGFNLSPSRGSGAATGIDLSPEALAFCRERGVRAARASLLALPFAGRRLRRGHVLRRHLPRLGERRPRGGRRDGARAAAGGRPPRPGPGARALWGAHDVEVHRAIATRAASSWRCSRSCGLGVVRATYCNSLLFPLLFAAPHARPPARARGLGRGLPARPARVGLPRRCSRGRARAARRLVPARRERRGPRPQGAVGTPPQRRADEGVVEGGEEERVQALDVLVQGLHHRRGQPAARQQVQPHVVRDRDRSSIRTSLKPAAAAMKRSVSGWSGRSWVRSRMKTSKKAERRGRRSPSRGPAARRAERPVGLGEERGEHRRAAGAPPPARRRRRRGPASLPRRNSTRSPSATSSPFSRHSRTAFALPSTPRASIPAARSSSSSSPRPQPRSTTGAWSRSSST